MEDGAAPVVREVEIINKLGLHARAAMKFVQTAEQFNAAVTVSRGDESADGTSILDLLMFAAGPGSTIVVSATGKEAEAAVNALSELVANRFGEDE
ncbi:MAG: HPr family phosphocarrier protein [Pseudolabrys sp.]